MRLMSDKKLLAILVICNTLLVSCLFGLTEEQHTALLQSVLDGTVTAEEIRELNPPLYLLPGLVELATHAENPETLDIVLRRLEQWWANNSYNLLHIKEFKERELHQALETAAWLGNVAATEKLLLFGVPVDTHNNEPLMRAVAGNKIQNSAVVALLLQYGANGFARDGAALREAVIAKKKEIVQALLSWAAKPSQDQIFSPTLIQELLDYTENNHLAQLHQILESYHRASSPIRRRISR